MKTKELKILAGTDSLTKIHNRRKIFELVEMELNRYERNGGFLSVIAVDLDRFKPINDKFGHFVGDIILRKVSSTIKGMIRKTDHIGRVGGDEFVILLPDTSEENAVTIAEKIRAMVELLKFEEKKYPELSISVSLGISAVKEKQIGVDKLLDQADMALYTSKQKGRNQISVY